jgi:hypothetical protein
MLILLDKLERNEVENKEEWKEIEEELKELWRIPLGKKGENSSIGLDEVIAERKGDGWIGEYQLVRKKVEEVGLAIGRLRGQKEKEENGDPVEILHRLLRRLKQFGWRTSEEFHKVRKKKKEKEF